MEKKYTKKTLFMEIVMIIVAVIFMIPLYYLVTSTFKNQQQILEHPLGIPSSLSLANYTKALSTMDYWKNFGNSFLITGASVLIVVIFGSMAAYSFSRHQTKFSRFTGFLFLLGFMVPAQTTMLPLFTVMKGLHLINTYRGMILLHSNQCVFAFMLYRGFIQTIPMELEEAARIDGCNMWQSFWKVTFPLLKPITITIVVFNVMWRSGMILC